jgi:hypothetical protein
MNNILKWLRKDEYKNIFCERNQAIVLNVLLIYFNPKLTLNEKNF